MPEYNAAFFNGLTAVVLALKRRYGEEQAIDVMCEVFSTRLKGVYDKLGFTKGSPEDFTRVAGENDRMLGLEIELLLENNKIIGDYADSGLNPPNIISTNSLKTSSFRWLNRNSISFK